MSAVSEIIVREYFEGLGFLVHQPRKYAVAARAKRPEEEIDLLVVNPQVEEHVVPDEIMWSASELKGISRAIVGVRGWHTDLFSPAMLDDTPEIFRFAEEGSAKSFLPILGPGPVAKILCLPGLSASDSLKARSKEILKARGIDGVLSFPTMLMELTAMVEVSKNYEKSDLLQVLRILKNYDLLKGPQLELFRRKKNG
jgi:hypothetical protein